MVLPLLIAILTLCQNAELVMVKLNTGLLNGELVNISTGLGQYYSFKGIPYAEAPIGSLRFKDPIPFKAWKGVRDARTHGRMCIQFDIVPDKQTPSVSSEDCLFLNVYSPSLNPVEPLPVLVYIHGGGYIVGSGDDINYGADFLVHHDVIVVTLNYRLGALGFLTLNTKEVPGNAGLKDQALALKWVHDNIQCFGGDPEQVTIMGQSAGGTSVVHHMMSPMSKGLFKRGIVMSGVPLSDWALPFEQYRRAFALGLALGNDTSDPNILLEFLQNVSVTRLSNTNPLVLTQENVWSDGERMYPFVPAPELDFGQERFMEEPAIESLKNGNIEDLDLLIGYTSNENLYLIPRLENGGLAEVNTYKELLVPREILLEITPKKVATFADRAQQKYFNGKPVTIDTMVNYLNHSSDYIYVYSVNRFLKHLPVRNSKSYLYKFFTVSDRNRYSYLGSKYNISGVAHEDDLRYLFDAKKDLLPIDIHSREYQLIEQTVTLFTNFVKYGNPTPDDSLGAIWPEYTPEEKAYMKINDTLTPGTQPDADVVDFWTRFYEDGCVELP